MLDQKGVIGEIETPVCLLRREGKKLNGDKTNSPRRSWQETTRADDDRTELESRASAYCTQGCGFSSSTLWSTSQVLTVQQCAWLAIKRRRWGRRYGDWLEEQREQELGTRDWRERQQRGMAWESGGHNLRGAGGQGLAGRQP